MVKITEYHVRIFSTSCGLPLSWVQLPFVLQKKRKAAVATNESSEAEVEDAGSPAKKKPTSSSKSEDHSYRHIYCCGRLTLAKGQAHTCHSLPTSVRQREKRGWKSTWVDTKRGDSLSVTLAGKTDSTWKNSFNLLPIKVNFGSEKDKH